MLLNFLRGSKIETMIFNRDRYIQCYPDGYPDVRKARKAWMANAAKGPCSLAAMYKLIYKYTLQVEVKVIPHCPFWVFPIVNAVSKKSKAYCNYSYPTCIRFFVFPSLGCSRFYHVPSCFHILLAQFFMLVGQNPAFSELKPSPKLLQGVQRLAAWNRWARNEELPLYCPVDIWSSYWLIQVGKIFWLAIALYWADGEWFHNSG